MSDSLAFNNETLLYNNQYEMYFNAPEPPTSEITIGTQTWMNKNLTGDDYQGGITTAIVNYGQGDVVEYYYDWSAAMRMANSVNGWHLPTMTEWSALATNIGGWTNAGTKLKSTYGWASGNGTDDYGFSVFPAGTGWNISSPIQNSGTIACFWAADYDGNPSKIVWHTTFNTGANMSRTNGQDSRYYTVRLIKD